MDENPSAYFVDAATPYLRPLEMWLLAPLLAFFALLVVCLAFGIPALISMRSLRRARAAETEIPWFETARLANLPRRRLVRKPSW